MLITPQSEERLQQRLLELTQLLERHRVLTTLTRRQEGPRRDLVESLQHRQNLAELGRHLRSMHAADLAYMLESLPPDDRRTVWEQTPTELAGHIFVEVSAAVRDWLAEATPRERLGQILLALDPEDLSYVAEAVPPDVLEEVTLLLESGERTIFEDTLQFPEDSVGYYMSREWVSVPDTYSIDECLAALRQRGELPPQTERVFLVDARNVLRGTASLQTIIVQPPTAPITAAAAEDSLSFSPHDSAADAAHAFERYDLVSAPVVDDRGKLVGRLTVDGIIDFVRHESGLAALKQAGLNRDEDLFASPWDSARNRWPWLGINLVTALVASRVIGRFEGAIQQLAALAALMPIVASIGGNTGNQTMALVIRALALDRIQRSATRLLVHKELVVSLLNGAVWGALVGIITALIYSSAMLGLVMATAVVLNLVVAALTGVAIPIALHAGGRDPAHGSSVLLTFITDAMGFFLFLGLASLLLI